MPTKLLSEFLNGTYIGGENPIFTGTTTLENTRFAITALGNRTGAVSIDLSAADVYTLTAIGNITFSFANSPTSVYAGQVTVTVVQDATGGRTITWPASAKFDGGTSPPATTTANAKDVWTVWTYDGGTTHHVSLAQKDVK